ncbi:MAG: hypothetical protein M3N19_04195, partial [Candidatus Eremiobacteraeota bacterium]|nr:hypothetical protein [Candidatus Eremiobacteraeota bacterium]
ALGPESLVIGKDGLVYFTLVPNTIPQGRLGRLNADGTETEFTLGASTPCNQAASPDGFLYEFDCIAHTIVKVSY